METLEVIKYLQSWIVNQ